MDIENNVPVTLTVKPQRTLDMVAAEIRAFTAGMLNNAIEIGRRMVEAKAMLPYGQFGEWITENTGYSASAANNFMRLFDEYGAMQGSLFGATAESQTFGKLPPSKALALLSVPVDEREAFAVEHDAEHTSVRELKRQIEQYRRERDEAVRKAEAAQTELETAEEDLRISNHANDRLRKELADAQAAPPDPLLLAEMREEETKAAEEKFAAQLAESKQAREEAEANAKKLERQTELIRQQLQDLKDARIKERKELNATITQAKTDAVAELQAQLDEANAAAKAASDAEAKLRQELDAARKASAQSASAAVDKDIARFEVLFNQAKDTANQMRTILLKYRHDKDGASTAEKLSGIMVALADAVKEAAK